MDTALLVIILVVAILVLAVVCYATFGRTSSMDQSINNIINMNNSLNQQLAKNISDNTFSQKHQLDDLKNVLTELRQSLDIHLNRLYQETNKQLTQMREVVDEKLNTTLEKRLNESFVVMNQRLENLQSGLGEMKSLAGNVVDLKKVMTNVKQRGVWGEVQLENLLGQIFTPEQYLQNVSTNPTSGERVDFAVVMPGRNETQVLLPIDAKFPIEDYIRIVEASEEGDKQKLEESAKQLETNIRNEAKKIYEKYINPPGTTDFALMFLPLEGLYSEVLRRGGLFNEIQTKYRVVICGPTTLAVTLNSLQMGFRTMAIEKRSSEVWEVLGIFKKEFSKYTDLLVKTQKQVSAVSNTLEDATRKTKTIQSKLRTVQTLTEPKSSIAAELLLELGEDTEDEQASS